MEIWQLRNQFLFSGLVLQWFNKVAVCNRKVWIRMLVVEFSISANKIL
jgi:hypothetical protein